MRLRSWALLAASGLLSSCTAFVAHKIEQPDRMGRVSQQFDEFLKGIGYERASMRTREGVNIAYWIGAPRAYRVTEELREQRKGDRVSGFNFQMSFADEEPVRSSLLPSRGSVVLLHPWGTEGSAMLSWAVKFSAAGYVTVMPDLRNQGASSKAPVGYGPREAEDTRELVHHLQRSGRLPGPLYLFGISYGGSVALFSAPALPDVRAVVALEPYADAADTIRRAPRSGLFGYEWLARWVTPHEIDTAIVRAGRRLGVDLAKINAADAVARSSQCMLILRGSQDELMTSSALRALSASSTRSQYVEVPGEGHLTLPMRMDWLFHPLLDWMQQVPAVNDAACPGIAPISAPPVPTASPAAHKQA